MGFTWIFLPPKSSSLPNKISHLQLSILLWLNSIWPMRCPWVGWQVRSVLLPSRIFMLAALGLFLNEASLGKWCLIVDLSSPEGASVNDGIDPDEFTLHYIKLDQVIRVVSKLGVEALVAKFDVEAAYRNVPIHPSHRVPLGMKWRDQFYVDLVLPFGLCSAPFIFNSIADMVEWILVNSYQIPHLLHYLDDFITAGPPRSLQCAQNLATAMEVCQRLRLPLHPGKCVGPSMVLTVVGIELDSYNQVARLPQEKLLAIQNLIGSWLPRKWSNRHELESLIGHLHHAAKVV